MDTERIALTAAAAMATVIIERRNQSRMMVSLFPCSGYRTTWLIELILCKGHNTLHVVAGCRIRTSSFRKGALFHAPSTQQPREAIVSLDAARLVINPVAVPALPGRLCLVRTQPPACRRV